MPFERTSLGVADLLHSGNDQCVDAGSHVNPGAALAVQSMTIVCDREAVTVAGGRITNSNRITTLKNK